MALSLKQKKILKFPGSSYDALICDGAIRSGKTSIMSVAFIFWAMEKFNGCGFALCGKSVGAVERNVLRPLLDIKWLRKRYILRYTRSDHVLTVSRGTKRNRFYLFGGRDESSYSLIQGITLAGVMLDEVALMPKSFVEQAIARCSVEGSKLWFNCNPENPMHWFKNEWIDKADEKNALHLHFLMDDNPGLSETKKEQYRRQYAGVFYLRYIKGLWALAEGLIYTMITEENFYTDDEFPPHIVNTGLRTIAVDYGTTNPCVFLDVWDDGETVWVHREWRWDSRSQEAQRSGNPQKTDAQYADAMQEFMGTDPAKQCTVVVDPSAASFITELRGRGIMVKSATNDVLDGIRVVSALLARRRVKINRNCTGLIAEMNSYVWDDKAAERGEEKPVKQKDHGPDALRYYCNTILPKWRRSI